ncbi:hypothetical protein Tco_1543328, partial [Tanacetum coccineum]
MAGRHGARRHGASHGVVRQRRGWAEVGLSAVTNNMLTHGI